VPKQEVEIPVSPEFSERCRQAGLAEWAICCMREVLRNQNLQAMPLVDFINNLALGVKGQTKPAEEIASIVIVHFQLQKRVLGNMAEICRMCHLLDLTADQTTELCLATESYLDPDGTKEMVGRYFAD
jgi:hypothetical protein